MLNRQGTEPAPVDVAPDEAATTKELGLRDLVAFLQRRRMAIAISVAAFVALGCLYLAVALSQYAATASLVVDTQKIQIFGSGDVSAEASVTNSSMETEIQILGSSEIAEAVVKKLDLTKNPGFMTPAPTPVGAAIGHFVVWVFGFLSAPEAAAPTGQVSPEDQEQQETLAAIGLLKSNLVIARDGLSYAISVTAYAGDPDLAARIANAITDAYLTDQIERQVGAARRLSQWLAARIEELRARAYEDSNITAQEKVASRATYENFVQRYSQAVQQQSLPETEAHVITQAVAPTSRVSPKSFLVLVASILLGGIVGFGVSLLRELLDRGVWTQEALERLTQSRGLGVLPRFRLSRWGRRPSRVVHNVASAETPRVFIPPRQFTLAQDAPFSLFSETLRRVKVASDFGPYGRVGVLGVVSSVPNEGKTTIAANLATQIGASAPNILLIDADFRNPSLSWSLTPDESPGLVQVLANQVKFDDALWVAQNSSLRFLPTGGEPLGFSSSEMLGSNRMKELMNELRERFDLIIIDLPPMVSLVDVRAADHVFDGFVFVVEWGVTTRELVEQALRSTGIQRKLIGSVFNKVKVGRLRRYDPSSAASPRNAYFDRYREVR